MYKIILKKNLQIPRLPGLPGLIYAVAWHKRWHNMGSCCNNLFLGPFAAKGEAFAHVKQQHMSNHRNAIAITSDIQCLCPLSLHTSSAHLRRRKRRGKDCLCSWHQNPNNHAEQIERPYSWYLCSTRLAVWLRYLLQPSKALD